MPVLLEPRKEVVASDDVNASHGLDRGEDPLGGDVLLRVPSKGDTGGGLLLRTAPARCRV